MLSGRECLEPDIRIALFTAHLHEQMADYEVAITELEIALTLDATHIAAINNLANHLADHRGDDATSVARALTLALQLSDQTEPEMRNTLGWALTRAGRVDEGLPLLREAATAKPEDAPIRFHFGVALFQLGDANGAKEQLAASIEIDPNHGRASEARETLAKIEQ